MKLSVLALVGFGLLAALCAAVLLASLNVRKAGATPPQAQILVAKSRLQPGTVVESNLVEIRKLPRAQAPVGACTDPVQVVGKILVSPVVMGQAFMPGNFAPEGSGLQLAGKLPPGCRAVTVAMPVEASMRGLLYPGSVVDVLVAFKIQNNQKAVGEAVSTTLLEEIEVLAVEDKTVGTEAAEPAEGKKSGSQPSGNKCMVTIKVDTKQAEALQLAAQYGTISLAMRNPTDSKTVDKEPTLLSGGRLAQMAELLQTMVANSEEDPAAKAAAEATPTPTPTPAPDPVIEEPLPAPPVETKAPEPPPRWQVQVFHGVESKTQEFELKN